MNQEPKFDVIAIGNALVDFIASCDDKFIDDLGLNKGGFSLIDIANAKNIYSKMGPATEMSGGSAANTIACLSNLGVKTGFIGSIGSDQVGDIFTHDIRSIGVEFDPIIHANNHDAETGRCYILVTPDAQRTMSTYLGIAGTIPEEKLNKNFIQDAKVLYVEGYMWVQEETKKAILKSVDYAHEMGNKAAFTLSDAFCVNSFRDEFLELAQTKFDIIFSNFDEAKALFQKDNIESLIQAAKELNKIFIMTCGADGAYVIEGNKEVVKVDSVKPKQLIDTTGAGDSFAAGFLYGFARGHTSKQSAQLGSYIASDIISHIGARSQEDLKKYLEFIK